LVMAGVAMRTFTRRRRKDESGPKWEKKRENLGEENKKSAARDHLDQNKEDQHVTKPKPLFLPVLAIGTQKCFLTHNSPKYLE